MKKKILVLGTCFTLLLTSCSSPVDDLADKVSSGIEAAKDAANTLESAAPEATPTQTPKPEKVLSLGDKATLGDWKVIVKKAEVKSKITNGKYYVFKPGKGNKFICITATVRNNGKEETAFLPRVGYADKSNFARIYYQDKYEYKPSDLINYDKDLLATEIKPLTNKSGIIAFEVPKKVANKKGKLLLKIGSDKESITYSLK